MTQEMLSQQFRRYLSLATWLGKDAVWRFKASVIGVVGIMGLGLVAQMGALGGALWYATALESGGAVQVFGMSVDPRGSYGLLLLVAAVIGGLLLASSGALYKGRTRALELRRQYEIFCSGRVLELAADGRLPDYVDEGREVDGRLLMTLCRRDSRYCGRVLASLVASLIPGIAFIGSLIVLLYLYVELSLLILLITGLAIWPLYKANVRGARGSQHAERWAPETSQSYRRVIDWVMWSSLPAPQERGWSVAGLTSSRGPRRHFSGYMERLVATERSRMVSGLLVAGVFIVVVAFFGGRLILEGQGWGQFLAYVFVLRIGYMNFAQFNQGISGALRFYPQVKRYSDCVNSVKSAAREGDGGEPSGRWILQGSSEGNEDAVVVSKGDRVGLAQKEGMGRLTSQHLGSRLGVGNDSDPKLALLRWSKGLLVGRPLRETLGLAGDVSLQSIRDEFESNETIREGIGGLPSLDATVSGEEWDSTPLAGKLACWLVAAREAGAQWVVIEDRLLLDFEQEVINSLLSAVGQCVIFILYGGRNPQPGAIGETFVILLDEKPEFIEDPERFRPAVKSFLHEGTKEKKREATGAPSEEAEVDDEEED